MRHNREIKIDAPPCLFCDKPLKPRMRQVWVTVGAGETISEQEFLSRAHKKLSQFLTNKFVEVLWRSYDDRALTPAQSPVTYSATLWVAGDFDGQSFVSGRASPCFCSQRCAAEFAEYAVSQGFRVRQ